ncbi:MAG: gamma-glutamyl-gamma-aminobutyrate hydrolase family protein [Chloroflexi bacterium]|nr:gamma-glutamyl-gamma-aminobutyrate hydrolase family protein [Chloroflexota bacterium]
MRAALRANKPILGVCLGSQLLATALGSEVFSTGQPEIGWKAHPRRLRDERQ